VYDGQYQGCVFELQHGPRARQALRMASLVCAGSYGAVNDIGYDIDNDTA
jgi:hypothetical protein